MRSQADEMILDVGPAAVEALADVLKTCRTLVWNGPLGAFETPPFDAATVALAKTAAALTKEGSLVSVAGGGDTVAALNHAGVAQDFTFVSTAGGAFLEWMEGRTLAGRRGAWSAGDVGFRQPGVGACRAPVDRRSATDASITDSTLPSSSRLRSAPRSTEPDDGDSVLVAGTCSVGRARLLRYELVPVDSGYSSYGHEPCSGERDISASVRSQRSIMIPARPAACSVHNAATMSACTSWNVTPS